MTLHIITIMAKIFKCHKFKFQGFAKQTFWKSDRLFEYRKMSILFSKRSQIFVNNQNFVSKRYFKQFRFS